MTQIKMVVNEVREVGNYAVKKKHVGLHSAM